jgi:short subunit dehydrogenase-like uncharacterized protein
MASRIVCFGATGYTGELVAERLVAQGARPLLAGRDEAKLEALAGRLGGLEWVRADALRRNSVFAAVGEGDVVVATVGPFAKYGEAAVRATIAAGATYLDSTGEPAFIRRVFEELGPPAARAGARLLTAMGYDFVPGALAGALALEAAGEGATRVDVGYYALGAGLKSFSAGTRESLVGASLGGSFAYRDGRVVDARPAQRVRSFAVAGRDRAAISVGGSEHYALPAVYRSLREVNVFLGWFGPLARPMQLATLAGTAGTRLPGVRRTLQGVGERVVALGSGPAPGTTPGGDSWVIGVAYDAAGTQLAEIALRGGDPYDFTSSFLAWAARRAAGAGIDGAGALGPVEAFGVAELEAGCAAAGLRRVES